VTAYGQLLHVVRTDDGWDPTTLQVPANARTYRSSFRLDTHGNGHIAMCLQPLEAGEGRATPCEQLGYGVLTPDEWRVMPIGDVCDGAGDLAVVSISSTNQIGIADLGCDRELRYTSLGEE
jgi:hypothetical protein